MASRRFHTLRRAGRRRWRQHFARPPAAKRGLRLEPLEDRMLLALGPQLIGISPNVSALLQEGDVLNVAPGELTFAFDEGQQINSDTLAGIRIMRGDGPLDDNGDGTVDANDSNVIVEPGFVGIGDSPNEVVFRFAEALPDDTYQIDVFGTGPTPLKNIGGAAFDADPATPGIQDFSLQFELDLGAKIVAVVPQPTGRDASGRLTQQRDQIVVYFNDDPLDAASAENRDFYQLIFSGEKNPFESTSENITIDGKFDDWADLPSYTDPANDEHDTDHTGRSDTPDLVEHPDVDLLEYKFTNDGENLYAYFRAAGEIGATQSENDGRAGRYYVIVTIDVDNDDNTGYWLNEGGYYPTSNGYDMNMEVEFYNDAFNTGHYLNHGARNQEELDTATADQIDGELNVRPGSYDYYTQWVWFDDPDKGQFRLPVPDDGASIDFVADKGPVRQGIIEIALSLDGREAEMVAPFRGFMRDAQDNPIMALGKTIDISFSLEASGELAPGGSWASDTGAPIVGYYVAPPEPSAPAQAAADIVTTPTGVVYDADTNSAVLTFAGPIDELSTGPGTYRLRAGTAEPLPLPPLEIAVVDDPGSSFATATELAAEPMNFSFAPGADGRAKTVVLSSEIDPELFPLDFPGANNEPGHRQVDSFSGAQHVPDQGGDSFPGISEISYNFQTFYGQDSSGGPLLNQITERQKDRAREALELWSAELGIKFYETADQGVTIATGQVDALRFGPTVLLDATEVWNDEFAENWFHEVLSQIGFALGLGATPDLPGGTLMGSDPDLLAFDPVQEPVFPGDHDIVHGQYLYRPESNDIDLYQFTLDAAGLFTAETVAERQTNSSLLDTVLRLYRQTAGGPALIAQNDDYYSNDSFIAMDLEPGNYYIGVSAGGNDQYDPTIEDSGFGGTSQGPYDLRLNFRSAVNTGILDATGVALDGDADGAAGGVFNFWFRTAAPIGAEIAGDPRTLFVDKSFTGVSSDPRGALANPFTNIDTALAAAAPGDIVRIAGNRGANNSGSALTDYLAYQIGSNSSGGELPDGRTMQVPRGVTVMVDAGAVFKMRRSAITVGSSSPSVDRSGAAIQILGTPQESVFFTSVNDEQIGTDITPLPTTPVAGDWGGIIIRNDVDQVEGSFLYDRQGIFLNTVNHADMRYGGGSVLVDSVPQVINPIHITGTRPTISFNDITGSADAAMSATPNSFRETNFQALEFQTQLLPADYDRVGPDIHDNRLVDNTTNGLFVRIPKLAGNVLRPMTVSGRWDDTDIVHVLQESLILRGQPGGPVEDPDTGDRVARLDARLKIDPGTVVKLEGARIEAQMGANFYAEGTAERPIVFTSLQDDRFGAGGTFDTNSDTGVPIPGDWAGVILGHTAIGSIDHAVLAYGGGVSPLEGSFAGINPVEIQRASARIVNSVFENNASGVGGFAPANRFGRMANVPATLFVRGAQPIIVNNVFRNNDSPVVNINANALNHFIVVDWGRATGPVDVITAYQDNQGPLIRANRIGGNAINGMEVRADTLTTEGVWDDTDIVHVLRDTIYIPNLHTFGGLRLESSTTESLVVKLLGENAGFTTTGTLLDIADRIGGRLQVVGQPGRPVVLTSLFDDTVGAGFDENGQPQTDTNNGGRPVRTARPPEATFRIELNFGPVILQNPDAIAAARRAASIWEMQLQDPVSIVVDVEMADLGAAPTGASGPGNLMQTTADPVSLRFDAVRNLLVNDAGDYETLVQQLPTANELNVNLPADPVNPFTVADTMQLTRANAKALGVSPNSLPGIRSEFNPDPRNTVLRDGRITVNSDPNLWDFQRRNGLLTYREDFVTVFLRELGEILGFTSSLDTISAALNDTEFNRDIQITPLDLFRFAPGQAQDDFRQATRLLNPLVPDHVFYAGGQFDPTALGLPIAGLATGEIPLAKGRLLGDEFNDFGAGYWLDDVFNRDNKLTYFAPIGVMDPVSGWRDNLIELRDPLQSTTGLLINISEQDREAFDSIGYDVVGGAPGDWQGIRMEEPTHDANVATIIEQEQPDVAAPGSNATPDTAQFLGVLAPNLQSGDDNKRLGFEVHGLLNSPADADIYSFTALAGTEIWLDIDRTSSTLDSVVELIDSNGLVLARADTSELGNDPLTTNPRDAGMRLVLPGIAGTESNQLVRVSSNLTSGQYQLQIRLQAGDMVPGTSVQFADIRYAETGVRIIGPPVHSPLQGDQVEDESPNDVPWERDVELLNDDGGSFDPPKIIAQSAIPFKVAAQKLGNLRATDQAAISLSGNLDASSDVDWYQFDVTGPGLAGVVLDIDYAAGLGRANTNLSVFDRSGTLVYFSDQANVAADLPLVLSGGSGTTDLDDLSRGSVSTQDPFIGPVILSGTWYVVVSSNGWVPADIANGAVSLDPIIPGTSGRGEIASGASGSFIFSPDPLVELSDVQIGEYQLEIRYVPVPELGFDANNATAGDKNRERVQSQIIIDSNSIRDSLEWGIVVEDSLRDMPFDFSFSRESSDDAPPFVREFNRQPHQQFTNADFVPHGAPPRALPVLDEERIVPGLTFKNNVITGGVEGGIQMQGDPDGFMLTTYNLKQLVDMIPDFSQGNIENTEFTIWDHQRKSVTFEFTSSGTTKHPGNVPLRFDLNEGNDDLVITGDFKWVNPPTIAAAVASEIEDAIRRTDLDVKVYRPNFLSFSGFAGEFGFFGPTTPNDNVLFIEGAIEIGHPDIWNASHEDVFNPDKSFLPIISAEVVQQGAVPFARIVNNTVVGRGGDLFATPGAGDIGILVEDNASPTILNNIIANFDTGYQTDLTSTDQPIDRRTFLSRFPINQFDFDLAELEALIAQAAPGEFGGFVGPFGASIRESLFNDGDLNPAGLQITEQGIFGSLQRTGSFFPWARDIDADPTDYAAPRPSVMGAAVYQGNLANSQQVGIGDFAIALSNTDPLFVDPASGNFLLADNSRAIDSSIERLGERDRLKAIKAPIGIAPSDVLAPDLDTRGQLRVDDPSVEPPAGFGDNVFKDRGALDRVDFVGPAVVLVNPADNDLAGFDRNPGSTEVLLIGASLTDFSIQLVDRVGAADPAQGVGIDDATVTGSTVTVTRSGTLLGEGIDYAFAYDATNDLVRLTALSGIWELDQQYVVALAGIRDLAGNELEANQTSGATQFTIQIDAEAGPLLDPWQNPRNRLDVNDDGFVTPLDVLVIFNDLNSPRGARRLPNPPIPPELPPPYLDVNADGFVAPIDALIVINFLNAAAARGQALVAQSVAALGVELGAGQRLSSAAAVEADVTSAGLLLSSPLANAAPVDGARPLPRAGGHEPDNGVVLVEPTDPPVVERLPRAAAVGHILSWAAASRTGQDPDRVAAVASAWEIELDDVLPDIAEEIASAWRE